MGQHNKSSFFAGWPGRSPLPFLIYAAKIDDFGPFIPLFRTPDFRVIWGKIKGCNPTGLNIQQHREFEIKGAAIEGRGLSCQGLAASHGFHYPREAIYATEHTFSKTAVEWLQVAFNAFATSAKSEDDVDLATEVERSMFVVREATCRGQMHTGITHGRQEGKAYLTDQWIINITKADGGFSYLREFSVFVWVFPAV